MAKIVRNNSISSTVSDEDKKVLDKLDKVITVSRAEFIRDVVMKQARKVVRINKG